jgi:tetratricopeptide (TPR) repeat protein
MSLALLLLGAGLLARAPAAAPAGPGSCAGARPALESAVQALDQGRWAEADALLEPLSRSHGECPDVLVAGARLAGRKGQIREARQALEKALRLDPAHAEAHHQLGVWFFRGRLHQDAVREFERVVALRPADARAYDYLALSREALGEAEGAEAAYRGALKVNAPGPLFDPLLDYNYGRFLLKRGRLEESRSHLDRAVALLPQRRGVHYERAKLHLALKDYASARRDAEHALGLPDPGGLVLDLQVYYLLATVYARLGETELARKYAELSRTTPIPDQVGDRP